MIDAPLRPRMPYPPEARSHAYSIMRRFVNGTARRVKSLVNTCAPDVYPGANRCTFATLVAKKP